MSVKLSGAIWELIELSQTETLIMLALADFSDEKGFSWPSKATLAKRTRVSKRTLDRHILTLAQNGWLLIQTRKDGTRFLSNGYQLNFEKIDQTINAQKSKGDSANLAGGWCKSDRGVVQPMLQGGSATHAAPEPSFNSHLNISSEKPSTTSPLPPLKKVQSDHAWFTAWWCHAFQVITGDKYAYTKKTAGIIKQIIERIALEGMVERACVYLTLDPSDRFPRGSPTIEGLSAMINQMAGRCTSKIQDDCFALGLLPDFDVPLKDHKPWENVQSDERQTATA